MDSTEQVAAPDTLSSQIEHLCKAVLELEACKVATGDKVQWAEIEEHFHNLEKTLKEKSEELEAREKEYEKKEADAPTLIAEREAAVASKKRELLDRMQDLKDAAVAAISEARATHQQVFVEPLDGEDRNNAKGLSRFWSRMIDANAQELAALKAVISCVEDYNLEADYPLDPLKKRVTQLDKCKSDRKRSGDFCKHQRSKKPRPSTGFRGFRAPASRQAPPAYNGRVAYAGMIDGYPHRGLNSYDYQVVNTKYAQASDQRLCYYSQDERITAPSNSSAMPAAYGSYMASGLQQPPHQPYM